MRNAFIVTIGGDPSVGLFSGLAKVTFEDSYQWDHDMVMGVKEALGDLYDVPVACVHEEAEYATQRLAEETKEAQLLAMWEAEDNNTETLTG